MFRSMHVCEKSVAWGHYGGNRVHVDLLCDIPRLYNFLLAGDSHEVVRADLENAFVINEKGVSDARPTFHPYISIHVPTAFSWTKPSSSLKTDSSIVCQRKGEMLSVFGVEHYNHWPGRWCKWRGKQIFWSHLQSPLHWSPGLPAWRWIIGLCQKKCIIWACISFVFTWACICCQNTLNWHISSRSAR